MIGMDWDVYQNMFCDLVRFFHRSVYGDGEKSAEEWTTLLWRARLLDEKYNSKFFRVLLISVLEEIEMKSMEEQLLSR